MAWETSLNSERNPVGYGARLMLVMFREDEKGSNSKPGLVLDLNARGTTLLTGTPLKKDALITLDLELIKNQQHRIRGQVVWNKPVTIPSSDAHLHSNYMQKIKFLNVPSNVAKAIVLYVCNWLMMEAMEDENFESQESSSQRRSLRAPLTLTLLCRDANEMPFSITTRNISTRGIQFSTNNPIQSGDSISLQIQLDLSIPTINVNGAVVWAKKQEDNSFEGGLQFTDLTAENRKVIIQYLKKAISEAVVA